MNFLADDIKMMYGKVKKVCTHDNRIALLMALFSNADEHFCFFLIIKYILDDSLATALFCHVLLCCIV